MFNSSKESKRAQTFTLTHSHKIHTQNKSANQRTKIRNLISFSYFIGEVGDFAWQGRQLYVSLVSCLYDFFFTLFIFFFVVTMVSVIFPFTPYFYFINFIPSFLLLLFLIWTKRRRIKK